VGNSNGSRKLLLFVAAIAALVVVGCGSTGVIGTSTTTTGSQLTLGSTTLDFGSSTTVGSTSTKTITVTSGATQTITITQLSVTGAGFSVSGVTLPLTLSPGQSATISILFNPQSAGTVSGNLTVASDAANSPASVPLTATAVAPASAFLSLNPSSLSFGSVAVGNSSSKSVVVSNSGNASMTISQLNVSGAGYSVSGMTVPMTVAAGASTSLIVNFAPTATGTANGSVSFVSTASNSPTDLPLTGTGAATPVAQLTANPTSVAFGNVTVGNTGTQSLAISNTGNVSVTISQITTSGAGFSLAGVTVPVTLAPGQSSTYTARFAPTVAGTASGQISVVSTASTNPIVSLSGTGVAPTVAQLTVAPSTVNFGSVTVGSSGTQSVSVSNTGNVDITISQISTSGAPFSGSGITVPLTLTPGQSAGYVVTFAPTSVGAASGQVSVVSNATTNPTVSLSGTGAAAPVAQLTASPTSLSFGNVTTGTTSTKAISLSNTGNVNVTVSQITVSGAGFSGSGITVPLTLTPGQSATYNAKFAPTAVGSVSGQVSFVSDASNSPTLVSLTGTGVAPITTLTVTPTSFAFNNVLVGNTSSLSGTLKASGGSVTVSSANVVGSGYSMSGLLLPVTLASGQSTTFTMTFAPTATGSSSGTLTFASNATNSPPPAALSGTGTVPHSVDLSWTASTSSGVAGYNVYRGSQSGGPYTLVNSSVITGSSFTDSTVVSGSTYFYVTTAVDGSLVESTYSNEAQAVIPIP
jgi:hypothetical protein